MMIANKRTTKAAPSTITASSPHHNLRLSVPCRRTKLAQRHGEEQLVVRLHLSNSRMVICLP